MKIEERKSGRYIVNRIGLFPIDVRMQYSEKILLLSPYNTSHVGIIHDKENFFNPVSKGSKPRYQDFFVNVSYSNGVYDVDMEDIFIKKGINLTKKGVVKNKEPVDLFYIRAIRELKDRYYRAGIINSPIFNIAFNIFKEAFYNPNINMRVTVPIERSISFENLYDLIARNHVLDNEPVRYSDFLTISEFVDILSNPSYRTIDVVSSTLKSIMKK